MKAFFYRHSSPAPMNQIETQLAQVEELLQGRHDESIIVVVRRLIKALRRALEYLDGWADNRSIPPPLAVEQRRDIAAILSGEEGK